MMSIRKRNAAAEHLRFAGQQYGKAAQAYSDLGKRKGAPADFKKACQQQARTLRRNAMHCRILANELEIR